MTKKDFLIIATGLIALVVIILVVFLIPERPPKNVNIITDKGEYKIGEALKVKIENNLKKNICFSSCYPYYWEKKNGEGWEDYRYVDCPDSNLAKYCVDSREVKAFELSIPFIEAGVHRLALSACLGCQLQEAFREDQKLYSNEFNIK